MAAVSQGLSCPLCLSADEQGSMVRVVITHHAVVPDSVVYICRRCTSALSRSYSTSEIALDRAPAGEAAAAGELGPGERGGGREDES